MHVRTALRHIVIYIFSAQASADKADIFMQRIAAYLQGAGLRHKAAQRKRRLGIQRVVAGVGVQRYPLRSQIALKEILAAWHMQRTRHQQHALIAQLPAQRCRVAGVLLRRACLRLDDNLRVRQAQVTQNPRTDQRLTRAIGKNLAARNQHRQAVLLCQPCGGQKACRAISTKAALLRPVRHAADRAAAKHHDELRLRGLLLRIGVLQRQGQKTRSERGGAQVEEQRQRERQIAAAACPALEKQAGQQSCQEDEEAWGEQPGGDEF